MPGIDTLLPAFFTGASARYGADAAARMAADLISARVARFFGLAKKGALVPGMDADIAVLRPGASVHELDADSGWSGLERL